MHLCLESVTGNVLFCSQPFKANDFDNAFFLLNLMYGQPQGLPSTIVIRNGKTLSVSYDYASSYRRLVNVLTSKVPHMIPSTSFGPLIYLNISQT